MPPIKKVPLSDAELVTIIGSLRAFRHSITSVIGIEYLNKQQRRVLGEVALDADELTEKLEKIREKED